MTSLAPGALERVDTCWAEFLGCSVTALRSPVAQVVPHGAWLGDYAGVYLMEFGAWPVISVPPSWLRTFAAAPAWDRDTVRHPERVAAVLGEHAGAVVGPALVAYTDARAFTPSVPRPTRPLGPEDGLALDRLRGACEATEWDHGGCELSAEAVAGAFEGEVLAAAAAYDVWGGCIAHISIVSHPAYRGRGCGRSAVSALVQRILERNLIPQYRTLEANVPSAAIARRLGFAPYAVSLAVRLRPPIEERE